MDNHGKNKGGSKKMTVFEYHLIGHLKYPSINYSRDVKSWKQQFHKSKGVSDKLVARVTVRMSNKECSKGK